MFFNRLLREEQRRLNLDSFDYVWTIVRDKHWDPTLGGLDWKTVREELRPQVTSATTFVEARGIMTTLLKRLGLSHFRTISSDAYDGIDKSKGDGVRDGGTGLDVRIFDGQATVVAVEDGSPGFVAGIKRGLQIEQIDGVDVHPILQPIAKAFEGSTQRELWLSRAMTRRLLGRVGDAVQVRLREMSGKPRDLTMRLAPKRGRKVRIGHLEPRFVWIDIRRFGPDIGYIAFNRFFDPAFLMSAFGDAMESFLDVKGIIVDLRGNLGGIGAMAAGLAGGYLVGKACAWERVA